MSTRSEVRFFVNKKLEGCVYHHSDGYPQHIIDDLNAVGASKNFLEIMKALSKGHGTVDVKCAYGDKSKRHQEDVVYAYEVHYTKKPKSGGYEPSPEIEKIEIYNIGLDLPDAEKKKLFSSMDDDLNKTMKMIKENTKKKKIFSGSLDEAYGKYVCKEQIPWR